MGKASKKLAKNQKKNKLVELKAKITEYKEAGNVKDALDIVIELFNLNTTQYLTDQQTEQIKAILDFLESPVRELFIEYPHIIEFMNPVENLEKSELLPSLNHSEEDINRDDTLVFSVDQEAEGIQEVVQSVQILKEEIAHKKVSLQEKITLYNSAAGQAYYENQLGDAEILLLAALELDEYNVESLRNMVLLAVAAHDTVGALQYAAKLPTTDFVLLKFIKDNV